jgi:uncharacterized protein YkwD
MKIIILAMLFTLPFIVSTARSIDSSYYIKQNDELSNLQEFRDNPEMIVTKLRQVARINEYRLRLHRKPVKLDLLACRVANMQCYNAAVNDYIGHWDMNGYKPYIRYSLAGGKDHVAENASGVTETGYKSPSMDDPEKTLEYMKTCLNGFMAEGPGGGHYENVINSFHNYVGIGYFCTNIMGINQIRYNEEFIDRYIVWDDFPTDADTSGEVSISGRVAEKDTGVYSIVVFYEKFPAPMSPSEISSLHSYQDYTSSIYRQLWPWEIRFDKESQKFNLALKFKGPGFYYVQVLLKKGISEIPYDRQPASASTGGLPNASGVVIRVSQ